MIGTKVFVIYADYFDYDDADIIAVYTTERQAKDKVQELYEIKSKNTENNHIAWAHYNYKEKVIE